MLGADFLMMPETLGLGSAAKTNEAEAGWLAAIGPFRFMRLLRSGRELCCLTLASTISDVCHGTCELPHTSSCRQSDARISLTPPCTDEMDRIYRIDIAGLSFAQDGVFNSLRGGGHDRLQTMSLAGLRFHG